jgi:Na+-translocating ferredoxin:NAD+ oxidoreductase RnfD subunit
MNKEEIYAGVMLAFFVQVFYDLTRTLVSQYLPMLSPYWQIALGVFVAVAFVKIYMRPKSATR